MPALGLALGVGCALSTAVYRDAQGDPFAKAGPVAALLWVLGIGARLAFTLYASHGGQGAIGRFSATHGITSGEAWVAGLILMAAAEVHGRSSVLAPPPGPQMTGDSRRRRRRPSPRQPS